MFWGAFILAYGIKAFSAALFPLFVLVFMIPVPAFIMEEIIVFAVRVYGVCKPIVLDFSSAPYYREGFFFHFPSVSVEVAPQCSGIRSGLSLFITALLAGYLFLNSWWRRIILVILRVSDDHAQEWHSYHDPHVIRELCGSRRILQSSLHREGGIPFFILALLLMAPILYWLRKGEGCHLQRKRESRV